MNKDTIEKWKKKIGLVGCQRCQKIYRPKRNKKNFPYSFHLICHQSSRNSKIPKLHYLHCLLKVVIVISSHKITKFKNFPDVDCNQPRYLLFILRLVTLDFCALYEKQQKRRPRTKIWTPRHVWSPRKNHDPFLPKISEKINA